MNPDPSEDAVDSLLSMGVCQTRDEAISRLQANGNDITRVIESYFENPTAGHSQTEPSANQPWNTQWDENSFHADKTKHEDANVPTFSIHASEDPGESLQPNVFGAPSRPPSRVNDRDMIDLTDAHAAADPSKSLSAEDRENADMRKALALSMGDTGAQETGVTNAPGTHFGRANRAYYDSSTWAMTTTTAHEIILDPEPVDRKRVQGEPAYLRPSSGGPYISSVLTILHSIPLAREAMIHRGGVLADYGQEEEWWKGVPVKVPVIVDLENPQGLPVPEGEGIVVESQRIMAFLDQTDRSYGSADTIAKVVAEQGFDEHIGIYLNLWREAALTKSESNPLLSTFWNVGVKVLTETGEEVGRSSSSTITLHLKDEIANADHTLYDAIDNYIWETNSFSEESVAYLEQIADVFTVSLTRMDERRPNRGIMIPALWYPDRYMQKSLGAAAEMRAKKAAVRRQIQDMLRVRGRMTAYKAVDKSTSLDPRKLLQSAIKHLEDVTPPSADSSMKGVDDRADGGHGATEKLKAIYDRVMDKLKVLDEQEAAARATLKEISSLMTEPSPNIPDLDPQLRYTLRGVSTDPNITYVLYPSSTTEEAETETTEIEYQWYRLTYSSTDAVNPVTRMKVDEDFVLHAATEEGRAAVLVYANEHAMSPSHSKPLPPPLETFVQKDNALFAFELATTSSTHLPHPTHAHDQDTPPSSDQTSAYHQSPSKRKASLSPPSSPLGSDNGAGSPASMGVDRGSSPDSWTRGSMRSSPRASTATLAGDDGERGGISRPVQEVEMVERSGASGLGIVREGASAGADKMEE